MFEQQKELKCLKELVSCRLVSCRPVLAGYQPVRETWECWEQRWLLELAAEVEHPFLHLPIPVGLLFCLPTKHCHQGRFVEERLHRRL
jgi:hypothetical protein